MVKAAETGTTEDIGNSAGAVGGVAGECRSIAARHREIIAFPAARTSFFIGLVGLQGGCVRADHVGQQHTQAFVFAIGVRGYTALRVRGDERCRAFGAHAGDGQSGRRDALQRAAHARHVEVFEVEASGGRPVVAGDVLQTVSRLEL